MKLKVKVGSLSSVLKAENSLKCLMKFHDIKNVSMSRKTIRIICDIVGHKCIEGVEEFLNCDVKIDNTLAEGEIECTE